jgi:hypothetical protein
MGRADDPKLFVGPAARQLLSLVKSQTGMSGAQAEDVLREAAHGADALVRDARRALGADPPPAAPGAPSPTAVLTTSLAKQGQEAGPPGLEQEPGYVHEPGGDFLNLLLHPQINIFEELYRVLPDDAWFQPTVSPTQPVQFELGSFTVPQSQQLWIYDYEFSLYRMSGSDPGDYVKAEAGRGSGQIGFDVTINGRRLSHLLYQLDPNPVPITRQSFNPQNQTTAADFSRAAVGSFASTASPGLSLLPVRRAVQGAEGAPFTLIAQQGDKVALSCVIFRRILFPIATIEGRHAGFLLQTNLAETLINRLRPR